MKITAYVLMPDKSVLRKKVINPTKEFYLSYKVNGKTEKFKYEFDNSEIFINKKTLFSERVVFYKHGQIKPLGINFTGKENTTEDLNKYLKTGLFHELVESAKDNKAEMSFKIIGILVGATALVLIVVFG